MGFCSKCGAKLSEDAYFCPKCGVRTSKGMEAGAALPVDEMKETFEKIGQEIQKAFTIASKEIDKAFKTARENIRQTTAPKIECKNCGTVNANDASFCYKCGKKL